MSTVSTRAKLVTVMLVVALAGHHQQQEQNPVTRPLDDEVVAGMIFIHLTPEEERRVVEAASSLFSGQCTEAFIAARLRSPYVVVTTSGVVFRPAADLYIYKAKALGLRDERTRKALALAFSSGRAQAGTVSSARRGMALTTDGRPHIFLYATAFHGESFWLGTYSLRDVLIHEFIHAGGQPSTPGWFGPLRHDLAGFAHYDRIMSACR